MSSHTTVTTCNAGPILPAEIMELVIDQLCSDLEMLCVCGMVCSEWLTRSRYHIFATVQLWPWRVRRFFELSHSQTCTFTNHVNCIEVDDAQLHSNQLHQADSDDFSFHKIFSASVFSRFSHITTLRIRNVDWTLLPPNEQDRLRKHLARFTGLKSLELDDVMFHDLRELARITALFPSLDHLVTNVQFSKYIEHTISSAATLTLPTSLETLRLGTDDAIPVLLSTRLGGLRLRNLTLDGVKFWHLQHIGSALRTLGGQLRHLVINFSINDGQWMNSSDFALLDLTHQTGLQTLTITGLLLSNQVSQHVLVPNIPLLVTNIPSITKLERLAICITPESDSALRSFDWAALERSLRRRTQCCLILDITIPSASAGLEGEVKEHLHTELKTLRTSGRLNVHVLQNTPGASHWCGPSSTSIAHH